jgi:uncharacterized protein
MVMSDIFDKLKSLQEILVKRYDIEKQITETPKQLESQEELLTRLRKEYIEKNSDYEEIKDKVAKIKISLDEAVKTREMGEKNMDTVTSHRDFELLEKQIEKANTEEVALRKELQTEEKKLEVLKETLNSTEEMIKSQEEDLSKSKEQLDSEVNSYNEELSTLKSQEESIVPDLDPEILFKFQRIIKRNAEGIVAVKNGVCTGCHMILPGQFANEVRRGENILFCPYCSRILFYEESDENEDESYFNIDDAGSLADLDDEDEEEYEEDSYDLDEKENVSDSDEELEEDSED